MCTRKVFAVIAKLGNVGVSCYLLCFTAERMKLTEPEESDGMLSPTSMCALN